MSTTNKLNPISRLVQYYISTARNNFQEDLTFRCQAVCHPLAIANVQLSSPTNIYVLLILYIWELETQMKTIKTRRHCIALQGWTTRNGSNPPPLLFFLIFHINDLNNPILHQLWPYPSSYHRQTSILSKMVLFFDGICELFNAKTSCNIET